jgi:hypothetical protein
MMTQTHVLLGAVLFAKPGHRLRNAAAVAGGILPDIAIFVMYGWEKLKGTPSEQIWREVYFESDFWRAATAWGNSAPLYIAVLLLGLYVSRFSKLVGSALVILAGACLVHLFADFFLHVDDAHAHFYPLSDWRFRSPISYWDPDHYGQYWSVIEVFLGLGLSVILFRRFKNLLARICLGLLIAAYVAVPAYFALSIGFGQEQTSTLKQDQHSANLVANADS